jgi:heme-degrading monooxygenase HmoA
MVKDGEEDDFVSAWSDFVSWASTWAGSGTFRLVRDVDDPKRFMSFAPWESFEAQATWKANPEFRERIGRVKSHTSEFTPSVFELVTAVN